MAAAKREKREMHNLDVIQGGNSATEATIRVVTTQDAILPRIITSAIDVYQPDLRASVTINDLNGPPAQPGDILEYTVVGKNIGSDVSLDTYMQTALDIRTLFVPNSIEYLNGPLRELQIQ